MHFTNTYLPKFVPGNSSIILQSKEHSPHNPHNHNLCSQPKHTQNLNPHHNRNLQVRYWWCSCWLLYDDADADDTDTDTDIDSDDYDYDDDDDDDDYDIMVWFLG